MRRQTAAGLLLAVISALLGAGTEATAAVAVRTISSTGPLEAISTGRDLGCQIEHSTDSLKAFFPPESSPADCGTLLAVGPAMFAPDFLNHDETHTAALGASLPFTFQSQSAVTGTGTLTDPYSLTTTVGAGTTGITVEQTDSYVEGAEAYRTDVQLRNGGGAPRSVVLYRGGDCHLGDSDEGYGAADAATKTVACSFNPHNLPADRILQWVPLSPGATYIEGDFPEVWGAIAAKGPLPGTCRCDESVDNAAALAWTVGLAPGQSETISHLTTFARLTGDNLVVTKTADAPTALIGEGNGYTITVANPNAIPIRVNTIEDTLPVGFSYVARSTSGATLRDPRRLDRMLIWRGPFGIPPGESITLDFDVVVSPRPGVYKNSSTATVQDGFGVTPATDVAAVDVGALTLVTTKTADFRSVVPGSHNGYTITVANPNVADVILDSVTDTLPAGFAYTAGSTTGTLKEPQAAGQALTWEGPFLVAAKGSFWIHLGVTVSLDRGEYFNEATATSTGITVDATGPTARVRVMSETSLDARPALIDTDPPGIYATSFNARLTDGPGGPAVAGKTLDFYVGAAADPVCSGLTDADGVAQCETDLPTKLQVVTSLGYRVIFAGDDEFLPSADRGALIRVAGTEVP